MILLSCRPGRKTRGRGWFEALPRRTVLLTGEFLKINFSQNDVDNSQTSAEKWVHLTTWIILGCKLHLTVRRDNASVPLYVVNEDSDEEFEKARKKAEKEEREERNIGKIDELTLNCISKRKQSIYLPTARAEVQKYIDCHILLYVVYTIDYGWLRCHYRLVTVAIIFRLVAITQSLVGFALLPWEVNLLPGEVKAFQ